MQRKRHVDHVAATCGDGEITSLSVDIILPLLDGAALFGRQ